MDLVLYDMDGMEVARVSGPRKGALHQMQLYFLQYSEDGPVRCVEETEVPDLTSPDYWEENDVCMGTRSISK